MGMFRGDAWRGPRDGNEEIRKLIKAGVIKEAEIEAIRPQCGDPSIDCCIAHFLHNKSIAQIAKERGIKESSVRGYITFPLTLLRVIYSQ